MNNTLVVDADVSTHVAVSLGVVECIYELHFIVERTFLEKKLIDFLRLYQFARRRVDL